MKVDQAALGQHLKQHLYAYIVLSALVLLNLPLFIDLVSDWIRDDNYSHGFFIIPISVYLFYRKRGELLFPAAHSKWGVILFAAGCVGLIFGVAASEFFTTRAGFVLMVIGLGLYYLGEANFRKVWFSFVFLFFMIPVPAVIYYAATLPMQLLASKVTVFLLKVIGMPVMREGNIISLPEYKLEVAEACSGLRSLVTLLALGALYGYMRLPGKTLPILLFVATVPIAIATNIFRIFVTAVGAYAVSQELAESFLHEMSGMLVFITALILMLILGAIMQWIRKRLRSS